MKVICILSGGLDSTTMLYWLLNKGHEVKAISFDYNQRHKRELEMAKATCQKLGVDWNVIDMTSITKFISNSALTGNIEVPHGHYEADNMKLTVVPSRNTIMASIANGYAANIGYDAIALGVHSGDHAIYPDCRPIFIKRLNKLFALNNFEPCKVLSPFLKKNKISILKEGFKLKVDYSLTLTCYEGKEKACGKCGSCQERLEAFKLNNLTDPLIYES